MLFEYAVIFLFFSIQLSEKIIKGDFIFYRN